MNWPSYPEMVEAKRPFLVAFDKSTLRVGYALVVPVCSHFQVKQVEKRSMLLGRIWIGDQLAAVNGVRVSNFKELVKMLNAYKDGETLQLRVMRETYSFCRPVATTMGNTGSGVGRRRIAYTGRPVEIFQVFLRMPIHPELGGQELGLAVVYNQRDQIQVLSCLSTGLAGVSLRPGDVIREVNGHRVASKSMFEYYLRHGLYTTGAVCLLVEALAGGQRHDVMDVSTDVGVIADKRLEMEEATLQRNIDPLEGPLVKVPEPPPVPVRPAKRESATVRTKNADNPRRDRIEIDHDPANLRPCQEGNLNT